VALAQLGALVHGRDWVDGAKAERRLRDGLDKHWSAEHQVLASVRGAAAATPDDLLDASVLLAVLDADLSEGAHSVHDPRVQATLTAIERLFALYFPINRARPAGHGPALGRWRGDRYFGGGAWYPTTLAAAGICYRLAEGTETKAAEWRRRGDAFMTTVRALTPADGALSEQVDRVTGAQTSARHLSWSYAAFIITARLRAKVPLNGLR
jgi:glucoamylase